MTTAPHVRLWDMPPWRSPLAHFPCWLGLIKCLKKLADSSPNPNTNANSNPKPSPLASFYYI